MWVQNSEELFHHGVKGMRWGVRRTKAQLSRSRGSSKKGLFTFKKKKKKVETQVETKPKKKSLEDMTDEELNAAIKRLELEKKYKDLGYPAQQKKIFDGRNFVTTIIKNSSENLGTQVLNEVGAKAINKAFGYEAVYANNKKK